MQHFQAIRLGLWVSAVIFALPRLMGLQTLRYL